VIKVFSDFFGGEVLFDNARSGYYKWSADNKDSLSEFSRYLRLCMLQSTKRDRFFLIKEFNRVVDY